MRYFFNDKEVEKSENPTLKEALDLEQISTTHIAVAINLKLIPRESWEKTLVCDNDKIIVIQAAQGG